MRNVNEGKENVVSDSVYVDLDEHCFDVAYDEKENNECCQSDYRFSVYADKSSKDKFKVHSDIQLDDENDRNQHGLDQHFQNEFSVLVTNQLFECEEVSMENKSDLMSDMTASRQQSDFTYSLQPETQGELQFFGKCSLVSGVDHEAFVFQISMHESLLDFDSQFSLYSHEHADVFSHNEHEVEVSANLYMHYEGEGSCFVLPSDVIQDANLVGKVEKDIFGLPQEDVNENKVFDRGKRF